MTIQEGKRRVAQAMLDLLIAIEDQNGEADFAPVVCDAYPFDESYDEIVARVGDWASRP